MAVINGRRFGAESCGESAGRELWEVRVYASGLGLGIQGLEFLFRFRAWVSVIRSSRLRGVQKFGDFGGFAMEVSP